MNFWSLFLLGVVAGGVTIWRTDRRKQLSWIRQLNDTATPAARSDGSLRTPGETAGDAAGQEEDKQPAADADREASDPGPPASATHEGEPEQEVAPSEQGGETDDSPAVPASHQLGRIRGIGSVYADRLHAAGIITVADLAALTPERIMEIVTLEGRSERGVNADDWIAQARVFADEAES